MPSLISATERANLTGVFNDIFDTFQRPIIVYKESLKVPQETNPSDFSYGFGDSQAEQAYTYVERTGIFPATIRYETKLLSNSLKELDTIRIPEGGVSVKVKKDARDFINDGKTEKIIVDGNTFLLDSIERKQTFLDSEFWVFILEPTR